VSYTTGLRKLTVPWTHRANPDLVFKCSRRSVICAGLFAQLYARLGGRVAFGRKPVFDNVITEGGAKKPLTLLKADMRTLILPVFVTNCAGSEMVLFTFSRRAGPEGSAQLSGGNVDEHPPEQLQSCKQAHFEGWVSQTESWLRGTPRVAHVQPTASHRSIAMQCPKSG
jgi:hypothetical protein